MEKLKQWVFNRFTFDKAINKGDEDFKKQLDSNIDNALIYYSTQKDFYEQSPIKCIELAKRYGNVDFNECESESDFISAIASESLVCLVYDYMFNDLYKEYQKAQTKRRK